MFNRHPLPFLPVRFRTGTQTISATANTRVDISPGDFAKLTLPIYKGMFEYMLLVQQSAMGGKTAQDALMAAMTAPKHYTPLSFARLLAVAGRRLRLSPVHFKAAINATICQSGLMMASNFQQEQVRKFAPPFVSRIWCAFR